MNKIFSTQEDWDELLQLIIDKKLTPVLGKEMYCYKDGDTLKPLDNYLSQKILEKNDVSDFQISSLPETFNYLELKKKIYTDAALQIKCIPYLFFTTSASKNAVIDAYSMSAQGFFIKDNSEAELEKTISIIVEYWQRCYSPNQFQASGEILIKEAN